MLRWQDGEAGPAGLSGGGSDGWAGGLTGRAAPVSVSASASASASVGPAGAAASSAGPGGAVLDRLQHLAEAPDTAPGIAARAARMRAALMRPVRVTVFGLPGTGKTDVVNLLAGAPVLPALPGLPTTEVVAGPDAVTEVTLADGGKMLLAGLPDAPMLALRPALLRVAVPGAPGLHRFELTEVVTDGTLADLAAAARWALPRTDIALWCTGRLTDADREAWAAAPEAIKDHAVMVLTGAQGPVPAGRPIRSGLPAGFRAAWPLWRARLVPALAAGDAEGFAASGAAALVRAVDEIATAGRAADLEAAEVLLARFAPAPVAVPGPVHTPDPDPVPAAGPVAGPVVAAVAAAPRPATAAPPVPPQVAAAARLVRDRASGMLAAVAPALDRGAAGAEAVAGDVLAGCAALAEDLAQLLQPDDLATPEDEDVLRPLRDAVDEVADLVVLMGIEGGGARAADAAALVAQLRRSFDRALAGVAA